MFYVYRNTNKASEVIAEFSDKDSAEFFMEYKALAEISPEVTGYAIRDYLLNTLVEFER
jgi:flagellar motor switch protein FliG